MRRIVISLQHAVLIVLACMIISCEKLDDTMLTILVVDSIDSTSLEGITVSVLKMKPGIILDYNTISSYHGKSNSEGLCVFLIDNFNHEDYHYDIYVNMRNGLDFVNNTYHGSFIEAIRFQGNDSLTVFLSQRTPPWTVGYLN